MFCNYIMKRIDKHNNGMLIYILKVCLGEENNGKE